MASLADFEDANPWAEEGPAIDPRATAPLLGPLLPPLPAKPKADRVKAKVKGLLGLLKRDRKTEKVEERRSEGERPTKRRCGKAKAPAAIPSSPLTPPPPQSVVPLSSPLSSPPPLEATFTFGTGTPHRFEYKDKGKGRAVASPSPQVVSVSNEKLVPVSDKNKHVPVSDDLPSLCKKRRFDEVDEEDALPAWSRPGPSRPMKGRVLDFGESATASSSSSEEVAVDDVEDIVPAAGLQKVLATIDEDEEDDSPVSPPETVVVVVKSPSSAEKVTAPVQRTGYPATSYSPGGVNNKGSKGSSNGHEARSVELARRELDAEPPLGVHPNFRDFHKALVTWLDAREHVFLRGCTIETLEENFAIQKDLGEKAIDLWLACLDIIWWGTEIVWPAKGEKDALPGDVPVGIEGVELDIVGFIGALLEFYDNDNTRTRSHILERTPDLFSQMGRSGTVVRLIGSGPWSPRLIGPVDPKVCRPSNPNNSKGIVKGWLGNEVSGCWRG